MELLVVRPRALTSAGLAVALLALLLALAAAPPEARAASDLRIQTSDTRVPDGYRLDAGDVKRIAASSSRIRAERDRHARFAPTAYTKGPGRWQVSWFDDRGDEVGQALVDDSSGAVLEAWTGDQVAWTMARGYEGAFGRAFNAPYVWIPLGLLFLAPFLDPRRPFRMLHLDLLVLLGFGVSHVFFNRGEVDVSAPLVAPVLAYLVLRLLWLGLRPRAGRGPLVPLVPTFWLGVALVALLGFRVGLNVVDSNVIDVGYAGVIGADHVADGDPLYGSGFSDDVNRGDTYGPFAYLLTVPFEQAFPWSGSWDGLPAAHAAAIAFDLIVVLALLLLGRRLRAGPAGTRLGIAFAYAWAAYPYTLFALATNTNDAIVAASVAVALLACAAGPARSRLSAAGRGLVVGVGAAAKFAPLALAPLFAVAGPGPGGRERLRRAAAFTAALAVVVAVAVLPLLPEGGLVDLYDRTIGYQAARPSPFSLWGRYESLDWLQSVVRVATVLLGLGVALLPRRSVVAVAALGGAVMACLQLGMGHWFYLYVVWLAPLALVALLGRHGTQDDEDGQVASPVAASRPGADRAPVVA